MAGLLFALVLFAEGLGIPLVAMPGTGFWGVVGWALIAAGLFILPFAILKAKCELAGNGSGQEEADPKRAVALRQVRDEITHIKRRLDQREKLYEEWTSIYPTEHTPFDPLPADRWNMNGAALNLPDADHAVVREAYELANDFNQKILAGPSHMGDPDPDIKGLRVAFEKADEVLAHSEAG